MTNVLCSRRCGVRFNTNRSSPYDCAYHSGRLRKSTGTYECCGVRAPPPDAPAERMVYCTFGKHLT
jgi:hypothetical protein